MVFVSHTITRLSRKDEDLSSEDNPVPGNRAKL